MSLNENEKKFISSIKNKINRYEIPVTLKDCWQNKMGEQVFTVYNNSKKEIVDPGIELYLIKKSFSYFLNKYGKVDIPGMGTVPMNPYYFQSEMAKEFEDYRKIVLDKSRQCGMSTIFALYSFWKANFFPAEMIDIVSTKQKKAKQFVNKIYSTMNSLPEWMRTPISNENQQEVTFSHPSGAKSTILSESQSDNAGRGDSLSVLILDEAAFYRSDRMAREIIASAQPTLSKTGGKMIIISTPNGVAGRGAWYYEQVMAARMGEPGTKYLEVDWWEIPDDERIPGPKKGYNEVLEKAIEEGYFHDKDIKQKYKDFFTPIAEERFRENEWLAAAYSDLQDVKYKQEVLHHFISSGDRVFSVDIIKKIEDETKPPVYKDKLGKEQYDGLWIWNKPMPGHRYILGVDVSSGTGADSGSIQVLDVETLEQVCEYKGFISTLNFAPLIKKVARYYNEGYVIIEANSIGEAVFNGVYYHENDPYYNCFKIKKTKNNVTRFTGWLTDVKTRKLITSDFMDWFKVDELWEEITINSKRLVLEMSTWIWEGNKPVHASGKHDDTIMAFAIALYNKDKAMVSGNSFVINEDGEVLEYDASDIKNISDDDKKKFDVVATDMESDYDFEEETGMTAEEFRWLVG